MATELINRYFELRAVTGGWLVTWQYPNMVDSGNKLNTLAKIVFDTIGAERLALAIELAGGELDYVEIDRWTYAQEGQNFVQHHCKYYLIAGCRLATQDDAQQLVAEFEKRLMWKRLQRPEPLASESWH